jgi:plastocyanin
MLKRFQHFNLMIKKVSIMIFIVIILIIVGYISSSELLWIKKNVHSIIIPENKPGSFIARGPIVSLLYNEGVSKSTFDGNHYEGNKTPAKSPLMSGRLFATNSDSNLTDSIMAPSGAIYDNRTLDSNNIDLLTKIILSSIYITNETAEDESSTKQFVLTAKREPQVLSGNWMFKVDQGIIKDFKAKFTMVRINGTEHNNNIYELYNFRPNLKNVIHISTSSLINKIDAKIDIKLNGENLWKDVDCAIVISKENIIKITLNSRLIENQFNNQPIYGIIESFEAKDGDHKTIEGLVDERSTEPVSESRSQARTNTTQDIFEIIDSLKKQSSHDIIAANATREGKLDQFYTNTNNLPYDMSRGSSIAEGHANVIIVKGADKPSNEMFFYPQNLFVTPGSTITWLNQDSAIHTATSTNGEELITNYVFDTDFVQTGQLSKPIIMPQQDGLISYYCKIHPFMTGTVTVTSTSD